MEGMKLCHWSHIIEQTSWFQRYLQKKKTLCSVYDKDKYKKIAAQNTQCSVAGLFYLQQRTAHGSKNNFSHTSRDEACNHGYLQWCSQSHPELGSIIPVKPSGQLAQHLLQGEKGHRVTSGIRGNKEAIQPAGPSPHHGCTETPPTWGRSLPNNQ